MAKTRDILSHVGFEVAAKLRKCHHNPRKHAIAKDTPCLTVRHATYNSHKNYCPDCAAPMVAAARAKLDEIAKALGLA